MNIDASRRREFTVWHPDGLAPAQEGGSVVARRRSDNCKNRHGADLLKSIFAAVARSRSHTPSASHLTIDASTKRMQLNPTKARETLLQFSGAPRRPARGESGRVRRVLSSSRGIRQLRFYPLLVLPAPRFLRTIE